MPSPLETLVKILKLERQQGFKNNAVIGGLGAYSENWSEVAHQHARKPEHHMLVDELADLLKTYEDIESKTERHLNITYMMNRITGREPTPQAYQARLDEYTARYSEKSSQRGKYSDDDLDDEPEYEEIIRAEQVDSFINESTRFRNAPDLPSRPRLARPPREPRLKLGQAEATDIIRGLNASVTTVKGVGTRMAQSFKRLGVETINDLLFFLPRRYDDYTTMQYISKLQPNQHVTVIGSVQNSEIRVSQRGSKYLYVDLDDGSAMLALFFFGQPYLISKLRKGKQIVVSGKVTIYRDRLQMANPEWEPLDSDNLHTASIVPIYPLTEGLTSRKLRRLMKRTVEYWSARIPDYVPQGTLERAELASLGWALRNLHFPESRDHLFHARNRFVFDQLLLLQMAILANRREWQSQPGYALDVTDDFLEPFIDEVFPYPLTGAQRRAIEDIRRDIRVDTPMNRLLQGDVGAGKTAVAVTALAMAYSNGKQAALMAPTSILAEQHYRSLSASFARMPGDEQPVIALLTGSLSTTERQAVYSGLADGSIDIVVGTHALIQEGVEFESLALVIVDEQHRFGVAQRGKLRSKGKNPHLLVMTATPIPRTLALTMHADLDLSVMDEMPPGRIPIKTHIVQPVERERVYSFIEAEIQKGRQAFMVYPLVEASDKVEAGSALEAYEHLSRVFFRHRVGLLHGRMKPEEKDDVMAAFSEGEFDVLVATSVAEVGIDVPNASVMAIEGANRFGLAQLHQFRGRVGRGQHASYCLLIPDSSTPEAEERLKAMVDTTDGFKLAEIDWKQRGAGDLIGTRQSGANTLQVMEAMTPQLVELAQREARTIYEEDPDLQNDEHHLLAERVDMLYNQESDVS